MTRTDRQDRERDRLREVVEAARELCHLPTCPCCDDEWECRSAPSSPTVSPRTHFGRRGPARERFARLREALAELDPGTTW